jgi:hypothetical protein
MTSTDETLNDIYEELARANDLKETELEILTKLNNNLHVQCIFKRNLW